MPPETMEDGTGLRVYTGGTVALELFLSKPFRAAVEGSRVVELGCGVGAIGIALSRVARARFVLLTDGSEACVSLARTNLQANGIAEKEASVEHLRWGDAERISGLLRDRGGEFSFVFGVCTRSGYMSYSPSDPNRHSWPQFGPLFTSSHHPCPFRPWCFSPSSRQNSCTIIRTFHHWCRRWRGV